MLCKLHRGSYRMQKPAVMAPGTVGRVKPRGDRSMSDECSGATIREWQSQARRRSMCI